ncbi:hypothetical protein GW17_00028977 [Ensete ventricosum]|nr:hypothetical protein GW17_00028977 [Ensete ventricosum]
MWRSALLSQPFSSNSSLSYWVVGLRDIGVDRLLADEDVGGDGKRMAKDEASHLRGLWMNRGREGKKSFSLVDRVVIRARKGIPMKEKESGRPKIRTIQWELAGSSLKGCQEFAKRLIDVSDNED